MTTSSTSLRNEASRFTSNPNKKLRLTSEAAVLPKSIEDENGRLSRAQISVYCFKIKTSASNAATHTHHGILVSFFFGFEVGGADTG